MMRLCIKQQKQHLKLNSWNSQVIPSWKKSAAIRKHVFQKIFTWFLKRHDCIYTTCSWQKILILISHHVSKKDKSFILNIYQSHLVDFNKPQTWIYFSTTIFLFKIVWQLKIVTLNNLAALHRKQNIY